MARKKRARQGGSTPEEDADAEASELLGADADESSEDREPPLCPLCDRPIPPEALQSLHHLVPVTKGGRRGPTALLHEICHNEIHAALTDTELARSFASIDALRAHPRLAAFRDWIAAKPPGFHTKTVDNHRGRGKRRS